jgi:hypothetical protein
MAYILTSRMAFALWIDRDLAWAQGLHEYRPMGVAVIAVTDRFHPRDFRAARPAPPRRGRHYAGLFASLSDVNRRLVRLRRSRQTEANQSPTPAWI